MAGSLGVSGTAISPIFRPISLAANYVAKISAPSRRDKPPAPVAEEVAIGRHGYIRRREGCLGNLDVVRAILMDRQHRHTNAVGCVQVRVIPQP